LTLRLIEAVRTRSPELERHRRAGKEWGLLFLAMQRRDLRKGHRLRVVAGDFDLTSARDRDCTEEERMIESEAHQAMLVATERAEQQLTRPQRRWFAAMKMSANAGAFFESSGKLNLAAASRVLAKDRSSAHRAFGELQNRFSRELNKLR